MHRGGVFTVDVKYLAKLSRMALPDDEIEALSRDMSEIMSLMDTLRDVGLPEPELSGGDCTALSELREDVPLRRMPEGFSGGFAVPKMME